jgi:hypothetical protein
MSGFVLGVLLLVIVGAAIIGLILVTLPDIFICWKKSAVKMTTINLELAEKRLALQDVENKLMASKFVYEEFEKTDEDRIKEAIIIK